ncbi:DHH family phosphoesterase [Candidatus Halobonum tyrrellensis]|uniref:Putative DHH superfamily phosphohydrolase n=1 Tax=Candidatus Halobonum tyrrellensis G22 TaxID=1324957 RepID=V4HBU9_9EURY|nr:DHH superfamily phosphohydrolase [Candidatus Halobonum tyrrellensis]ESP87523.1 putative DHH superfamily phosphohydrolase [Candidatus Halobonum tyrrellensis G22]
MDDALIDTDTLSLERRSKLPGKGFFYPDSLDEDRAEERAREALSGAEAVVVTDSDADGLGCIALIREAYGAALDPDPFLARLERTVTDADDESGDGDDPVAAEASGAVEAAEADGDDGTDEDLPESSVALLPSGPHSFEEDLGYVAEYLDPGTDVFVCDICPDEFEYVEADLRTVVERAGAVRWFDHHQWDDDLAAGVAGLDIDLVVGESDEECSTDVTLRSLDYEFPDRFRELAAVTRDHDLWLNEDDRSDDLADYAYWTDAEEYAAVVGAYGADLPPAAEAYVAERRVEKERLIAKAVERAESHEVGAWTVGVTYGRCSQNEVADELRERGADAAVVVKPSGSASIRGSESFERCHEVARQVDGGGHPKASGCKPDVYDDMLDYARHWTSEGRATKRVILAAFERVAERAEAEAEAEADDEAAAETADAGAE